ncbi:MAG: glycosyltransferase [Pseudomonadota bacterium]
MSLRVTHYHFGREGGAERFFVNLATALNARGVEQRFVIRPNRTWGDAVKALGPVIESDFSNLIRATGLVQWRIARVNATWRPHAHMSWMPRAAKLLPRQTKALRVTRLGDFPANIKHFGRTDVLVGNVPGIIETAKSHGWDRATEVITNFPRNVSPKPLDRSSYATPEDAFLIVAGARFVPRKGMDIALRALAGIPGAYLWLMGDGAEMPALRQLASELGLEDRVRFLGWIDETLHGIAAGDAFLMPSRHEPLGNMLIEAWQAGIPSVSTRSEGPEWFMRDGVDGLMTEIDDVEAITAALIEIRDNPSRAADFTRNARTRLDEMFSERAITDAYIGLLSRNREAVDG